MCIHLKQIKVQIKKPRKCWGCCDVHTIGEYMFYSVWLIDSEIIASYWCDICKKFLQHHGEDLEVGYGELKSESVYKAFKKEILAPTRKLFFEKTQNLATQS